MTHILPTIVVVDDSATAISLYQLSAAGLAVDLVAFTDADSALDYLKNNQPDLVFLDIVMPEKDGITMLKELRAFPVHSDTPVIMVTSKDYDQDRTVTRELGALEFMLKPLRSNELRSIMIKYTDAEIQSSANISK